MMSAVLLLFLSSAHGLRIITRSMIRTPAPLTDQSPVYEEVPLRPVPALPPPQPLVTSQHSQPEISDDSSYTTQLATTSSQPVRHGYQLVPLVTSDQLQTTTPLPEGTTTSVEENLNLSTSLQATPTHAESFKEHKRTKLYPVGRLWTEDNRAETDIWSLLHAAYICLFSGLHCFSDRVLPMFKSYLGISEPLRPSHYLLPRAEDGLELREEGRRILKSRLIKDLLFGLILAHTALLPWIGSIGLASGKALLTGILSLGAAGAVAAWPPERSYFM